MVQLDYFGLLCAVRGADWDPTPGSRKNFLPSHMQDQLVTQPCAYRGTSRERCHDELGHSLYYLPAWSNTLLSTILGLKWASGSMNPQCVRVWQREPKQTATTRDVWARQASILGRISSEWGQNQIVGRITTLLKTIPSATPPPQRPPDTVPDQTRPGRIRSP